MAFASMRPDDHVLHLKSYGFTQDVLDAANAKGIVPGTILQWIITYGLPVVLMILKLLGIPIPPIPMPPVPPLPGPVTP